MSSFGAVVARQAAPPSQKLPRKNYLISTFAPASSNFFLMAAASSLLTPSLTVLGAPSTRSLASFKPRLVTSRTALMTLILLPPTSVSTTVNSVFSSAGAAPPAAAPPPPAATTVAAAAETQKVSSIFFTSSDASSSVRPLISSRIVSTFAMILSSPLKNEISLGRFGAWCRTGFGTGPTGPKLVDLDGFADGHREVARERVQGHGNTLRRSVQQEHNFADELFLRRQVREPLNLGDGDDTPFHDARFELKRGNVFGDLRKRLGQRHRIGLRIGDGIRAAQVLEQILRGCASAGTFCERVFHHLVFAAGGLHGAPKLCVRLHRNSLKSRENDCRDLRQFGFQLVQVLLLLAALFHNLVSSGLYLGRCRQRLRFRQVNRDARSHRGRQRNSLDIFALGCGGLGFDHCADNRVGVLREFRGVKLNLADGAIDNARLVYAEFDFARFGLLDRFSDVERDRPGLWVRHQAARPENFAELTGGLHHVRRGDHRIVIRPAAHDLLHHVVAADEVCARVLCLANFLAARNDQHAHGLAQAVR